MFQHGNMDLPAYAYEVFKTHFDLADLSTINKSFVALELGPGDSLFSAMIAHAFGASTSYLIDVGSFASKDLKPYRAMANFLREKGLIVPKIDGIFSLEELLASCKAYYLTHGLTSIRTIADQSINFIWSQAVLEHIKRRNFLDMMKELRRVIRADGVCSHRVDLKDHLGGALNNLRFSQQLWESDLMANSGFYTNRIRYTEMLELFNKAGFNVEVCNIDRWDRLPSPKSKFAYPFRHLPDDELCVSGFNVILRPA